jgi:anthranilate synthase component 1
MGRYTFLGYDPRMEITCVSGKMTIKGGGIINMDTSDPASVIRGVIADNRSPRMEYLPPFTGGLVGYFSYDYIKYAEPSLILDARDEEGFKDLDLMLFDKVIAFDNYRQKIILIVNIRCDDIESEYHRAEMELQAMKTMLLCGGSYTDGGSCMRSPVRYLFGRDGYCEMVRKAKDHIRNADIYQVVLSNLLEADFEGSLLDTYRVLRTTNPSPYMFYFSSDDLEIAGASPRPLLSLRTAYCIRFRLPGRGREAKRTKRTARLKRSCSPMRRNAPSIICSSISGAMISVKSAASAASRSKNT